MKIKLTDGELLFVNEVSETDEISSEKAVHEIFRLARLNFDRPMSHSSSQENYRI